MTSRQGPAPQVGSTFGPYRIDRVVGVGGMGMVFGAQDQRLGRVVALKVVLGQYAESEQFVHRFQREAASLARLDSPHVISIYDHGEHDGWPFIVTQYAAGGDLGQRLRERGPMPPQLALTLCAQVADALVAAHAVGVVHRDVKPANVLLRDDRPDRLHVYLCDFGVALSESSGLTNPGSIAGSWNYLAPERVTGEQGIPASDLYSVGCLLWEALTGRPPYEGADVDVAMAHLHAPVPRLTGQDPQTHAINEVLARTLAKDPAHRFASATELRDHLRRMVTDTTHSGATPLTPITPPRRRRGRALLAGTAALTLVAAAATAAFVLTRDDTPAGPDGPVEVADPVPGDLDGDGLGDFGAASSTGSQLLLSDGSSFGDPEPRPELVTPVLAGDVTGDGVVETLVVSGAPPLISVTVTGTASETSPALVSMPPSSGLVEDNIVVGDVDGDQLDDLVVITRDSEDESTVNVALSLGDGAFAEAEPWYVGVPTEVREDFFLPELTIGDFDADGRADLLYTTEVVLGVKAVVLRSTGRAFEPVAEPQELADVDGSINAPLVVADVDGDGTPEAVSTNAGPEILVFTWDGRAFDDGATWYEEDDTVVITVAAPSDVDGDGLVDLVVLTDDDTLNVLRSTGEAFEYAEEWRVPLSRDKVEAPIGRSQ